METRKPKILFADDEASIRDVIGTLMGYACPEYEIVLAENGRIAYAKFEEAKKQGGLALILTDLKMPDLDGAGFARMIRENYPDDRTPLVLLTGYSQTMLSEKDRSYFREILMKPISLPNLRSAMQRHLQPLAA